MSYKLIYELIYERKKKKNKLALSHIKCAYKCVWFIIDFIDHKYASVLNLTC